LSTLDTKALRQKWLTLYGDAPRPAFNRSMMIRAIAYRIQQRALGGLKPATRRFLRQFLDDSGTKRHVQPPRALTPGTVLGREWHGTSHQVTVLDTGCSWRGKRYASLSEVARAITGARWSGPRFFGVGLSRGKRLNGTSQG